MKRLELVAWALPLLASIGVAGACNNNGNGSDPGTDGGVACGTAICGTGLQCCNGCNGARSCSAACPDLFCVQTDAGGGSVNSCAQASGMCACTGTPPVGYQLAPDSFRNACPIPPGSDSCERSCYLLSSDVGTIAACANDQALSGVCVPASAQRCRLGSGSVCACVPICSGVAPPPGQENLYACALPPPAACPGTTPTDGAGCAANGLICQYGTCGGSQAICQSGHWKVTFTPPPP